MTSPKQAFQKTIWAKDLSNVLESEAFQQGMFAALLQMQMDSPETTDPVLAAVYDQRLVGARQFVRTLSRLCESDSKQKPDQQYGNLNHNV